MADEQREAPPAALDKEQKEFHVEEYKGLRAEVIAQGAKYDQLKIWLLAGLGAFYGWIFTTLFQADSGGVCLKINTETTIVIALVPLVVSIMSALSAGYLLMYFERVGVYFQKTREKFRGGSSRLAEFLVWPQGAFR